MMNVVSDSLLVMTSMFKLGGFSLVTTAFLGSYKERNHLRERHRVEWLCNEVISNRLWYADILLASNNDDDV